MSTKLDIAGLAARLRAKRGNRGLRSVAAEIGGVSASTLSRIEQGHVPDLDTFILLTRWLGVSTEEFLLLDDSSKGDRGGDDQTTPELIEAHLRADRVLAPDTIDALATMIRLAYEAAERGDFDDRRS